MNPKKNRPGRKVAAVFANNEIVSASLRNVLEDMGYEVRQDIDSCMDAEFAVVGAYFAYLGIVKQLRATNPLLPVVVMESPDYKLNGSLATVGEVYDVIRVNQHDASEIEKKLRTWFSKGQGKCFARGNEENAIHHKRRIRR